MSKIQKQVVEKKTTAEVKDEDSVADVGFNLQLFNSSSPVTKKLSLSDDGKLIKDATKSAIYDGTVRSVKLTFGTLPEFIGGIKENQAISLSNIDNPDELNITTKDNEDEENGFIARTKNNFPNILAPALMLLDIDTGGDFNPQCIEDVFAWTGKFLPIDSAAIVIKSSTSACVSIKETGEELTGNTNIHAYVLVKDGSTLNDTKYVQSTLLKRARLAGVGYIVISKSGAMLVRCPIDVSVLSPERVVFETDAILSDDLVQNKDKTFFQDGGYLDLTQLLKPLTDEEEAEVKRLDREDKAAKKPEADKIRKKYLGNECDKLVSNHGFTQEVAEVIVRSRLRGNLHREDLLYFDDEAKPVSVGQVIDNPDTYIGMTLADPQEPCRHSEGVITKNKAKVFKQDDGNLMIHSFLHGGHNYYLNKREPDELDKFISEHAIVMIGSNVLVAYISDGVLSYMTKGAAAVYYGNRYHTYIEADGSEKVVKMVDAWISDSRRITYAGIEMNPIAGRIHGDTTFTPGNKLNLHRGMATAPKKGNCELILDHLYDVICDGDGEKYKYLLDWTASLFQYPDKQGRVALIFKSKEGAGKGTFTDMIRYIIGYIHSCEITRSEDLTGKFNDHLARAIYINLNEALWGGNRQSIGALKSIITDPTLSTEAKFQSKVQTKNCIHLTISTNEDWSVPVGLEDRRFVGFDVSDHCIGDRKYFRDLLSNIYDEGGAEAFLYKILNRNISKFNPDKRPKGSSDVISANKLQSADSVIRWVAESIDLGYMMGKHDNKIMWDEHGLDGISTKGAIYDSYCVYCNKHREHHPINTSQFGAKLIEYFNVKATRTRDDNGDRIPGYRFPGINDCQDMLDKILA